MATAHRTATTALLVVSLASTVAPTASARPGGTARHPRAVYSRQDKSLVPNDPPPAVVRISSPGGGFDWADAGIGAAGGFALSMIGSAARSSSHSAAHATATPPRPADEAPSWSIHPARPRRQARRASAPTHDPNRGHRARRGRRSHGDNRDRRTHQNEPPNDPQPATAHTVTHTLRGRDSTPPTGRRCRTSSVYAQWP